MEYTKIFFASLLILGFLSACGSNEIASSSNELGAQISDPEAATDNNSDKVLKTDNNSDQGNGENNPQSAYKKPNNFDYEAIAKNLGVTTEDLQTAIERNSTDGFINFADVAATLNIDEEVLTDAFKIVDGGLGGGKGNQQRIKDIDFASAAATLNISEEDLHVAIESCTPENGPMDIEQVALALQISIEDLQAALSFPKGMGGRSGSEPNN